MVATCYLERQERETKYSHKVTVVPVLLRWFDQDYWALFSGSKKSLRSVCL